MIRSKPFGFRAPYTLQHIEECFEQLDKAHDEQPSEVVALALWFHDAIYDPRALPGFDPNKILAAGIAGAGGYAVFGEGFVAAGAAAEGAQVPTLTELVLGGSTALGGTLVQPLAEKALSSAPSK